MKIWCGLTKRKIVKVIITTKCISSRRKEKVSKKCWRMCKLQNQNYWMSKNDIKSPLLAFSNELWAVWDFHIFKSTGVNIWQIKIIRTINQPQNDPTKCNLKKKTSKIRLLALIHRILFTVLYSQGSLHAPQPSCPQSCRIFKRLYQRVEQPFNWLPFTWLPLKYKKFDGLKCIVLQGYDGLLQKIDIFEKLK